MNKKEIQKTEKNLPAEITAPKGYEEEVIDNEDLVLPTIRLLQATSGMVEDAIGLSGEFRCTSEKSFKLGDPKSPLEFIPLGTFKNWVIRINKEFDSIVPVTAENIDWEWESLDEKENVIRREKWFNVYVLTPRMIANGEVFPAVLSFKGTSYKAGKQFASHVKMMQSFKKAMFSKVFSVSCEQTKNEHGTFHIMKDVEKVRNVTQAEMDAAFQWHKLVKETKKITVNYEETEGVEGAPAMPEVPTEESITHSKGTAQPSVAV